MNLPAGFPAPEQISAWVAAHSGLQFQPWLWAPAHGLCFLLAVWLAGAVVRWHWLGERI